MREASRELTEAAGQALLSAERGLDGATSALMTWCAKHGVDNRDEAIETIRIGEVERRRPAGSAKLRGVKLLLRKGLDAWTTAGRDAEKFKAATVQWREEGRSRRQLPVSHSALLG